MILKNIPQIKIFKKENHTKSHIIVLYPWCLHIHCNATSSGKTMKNIGQFMYIFWVVVSSTISEVTKLVMCLKDLELILRVSNSSWVSCPWIGMQQYKSKNCISKMMILEKERHERAYYHLIVGLWEFNFFPYYLFNFKTF